MRRQRGFTFIELLIAMTLTAVGLLGMMTVQMVAIRSNSDSRSISEATSLAQDKLEHLAQIPLGSPLLVSSVDASPVDVTGATAQPRSIFTRATTVTAGAAATTERVVVSWPDGLGRTHSVTVNTVRAP